MHSVSFVLLALSLVAGEESDIIVRDYDLSGFLDSPSPVPREWPTSPDLILKQRDESWSIEPNSFNPRAHDVEDHGPSAEGIAGVIREIVSPGSGSDPEGGMEVEGTVLKARQSAAGHRRIEEVIAALRALRAGPHGIEVLIVPSGAVPPGGEVGSPLPKGSFDSSMAKAGPTAVRFFLRAPNGQPARSFRGSVRQIIARAEVNATGPVSVLNPVIEPLEIGAAIEVEPLRIGPGDRLRLKLRVARTVLAGEMERRQAPYLTLDLPRLAADSLETVLVLQPGEEVLAGSFRDAVAAPAGDFAVLVRVASESGRPSGPATIPGGPDPTRPFGIWEISSIIEDLGGEKSLLDGSLLMGLIRSEVAPAAREKPEASIDLIEGRWLVASAPQRTLEALDRWLKTRIDRRAQQATIDLEEVEGPAGAILALKAKAGGGWLPDDWRDSEEARRLDFNFRARLAGPLGVPVTASGIHSRTFVGDAVWYYSGCPIDSVDPPDPIVETIGSGFRARATVRKLASPDLLELDLRLYRARSVFEARATIMTPSVLEDDSSQWVHLPLDVDFPRQDLFPVEGSFVLAAGKPALLRISPAGHGRARALIGWVRVEAAPPPPSVPATERSGLETGVFDIKTLIRPAIGPSLLDSNSRIPRENFWYSDFPWIRTRDEMGAMGGGISVGEGLNDPLNEADILWLCNQAISDPGRESLASVGIDPSAENQLGHRLVAEGGPEAIEDVSRLLTALKARRARQVVIDLALVPREALQAAAPGWEGRGGQAGLEAEVFDRAVLAGGDQVDLASTIAAGATAVAFAPLTHSAHLRDFTVSQVGPYPVNLMVIGLSHEGFFAEVAAFPTASGGSFRIDARLGRRASLGVPEKRKLPIGELDLLRERTMEIATVVVAPSGRTVVLGSLAFPPPAPPGAGETMDAPQGFVGLVRVRPLPAPAPPPADSPVILETSLFLHELPLFKDPDPSNFISLIAGPESRSNPVPLQTLTRLLRGNREKEAEDDNGVEPRFPGGAAFLASNVDPRPVIEGLEKLSAERFGQVVVDIWQCPASPEETQALTRGSFSSGEWASKAAGRPAVSVRASGTGGARFLLASLVERDYMADCEMVSGGSGQPMKVVKVPDPDIRRTGEGLAMEGSVKLLPGGSRAILRMRGGLTGPIRFRQGRFDVQFYPRMARKAEGKVADKPLEDALQIDLPEAEPDPWSASMEIPLGTPVLLAARPDSTKPDRITILVALVRTAGN